VSDFSDYQTKFDSIDMQRDTKGVLELTFHSNGGSLEWSPHVHGEWVDAFGEIAADPMNRVVIMTGTGNVFSGPRSSPAAAPRRNTREWEKTRFHGTRLLTNLLAIEAPIIAAVNGPALRHIETPLLSDIVLATEETVFQDSGHFRSHTVPGDGMHVVLPFLMGATRASYFLLMGEEITASRAQELGLVNEIVARGELLERARVIASQIADKPDLVLRYTRVLLKQALRRQVHDLVGYGLALEGLGMVDRWLADNGTLPSS
jgi:enoyl-CoA hydratase/carnithine racemase